MSAGLISSFGCEEPEDAFEINSSIFLLIDSAGCNLSGMHSCRQLKQENDLDSINDFRMPKDKKI